MRVFIPLRLMGLSLSIAVLGCSTYEPKSTAEPTAPLRTPEAASVVANRVGVATNLDHLGNLRGSDTRVLGFEMPMGSEATGKGESRYIAIDEERLVRFFKSRGYLLEEVNKQTYRVGHTPRTLALITVKEGELFEPAKIYMGVGPGSGYTMWFNKGRATVQVSLHDQLAEAERQHDAAFQKAAAARAAEIAAAKLAKSKLPVDPKKRTGFGGVDLTKKHPVARLVPTGGAKERRYTTQDLARLRREAASKPLSARQKVQREKIRAWERKTGEVFRD